MTFTLTNVLAAEIMRGSDTAETDRTLLLVECRRLLREL